MAFFLDVGTDLYGVKQNTRLEFAGRPTLSELIISGEAHFDKEQRIRRPAGAPDGSFKIQTMQVYDDVLLRWVDLYSSTQLTNGGQVWCFQPETAFHGEAPGTIPAAKYSPESWLGSPARARAVAEAGIRDPVMSEKLRSVFYNMDTSHNRYITYDTLRDYFGRFDIPWTSAYVGDYYGRSGVMTYDDWVHFAAQYPYIIDSLYYRPRGSFIDKAYYSSALAEAELSVARARREGEIRSYYTTYNAERARLDAEYRARQAARDAALYYRPYSPRYGYL
ncbi:flagellar protein essential for flagellar pocket biogenesis [Diplonema papillatum]|nr:flagellar protein essential for flagellar pocket biogenesis [Diplonema papillatum]